MKGNLQERLREIGFVRKSKSNLRQTLVSFANQNIKRIPGLVDDKSTSRKRFDGSGSPAASETLGSITMDFSGHYGQQNDDNDFKNTMRNYVE